MIPDRPRLQAARLLLLVSYMLLSVGSAFAFACDEARALHDMRAADADTRIAGIACATKIKQPSTEIRVRLAELLADKTRGSSRGIGLLDNYFPGQREYSEQVAYAALGAVTAHRPSAAAITPILDAVAKSSSDKQAEVILLRRYAFEGYRAEIVDGLRRIIPRAKPVEKDPSGPGTWHVDNGADEGADKGTMSLSGVPEQFNKLQFLLRNLSNDILFAKTAVESGVAENSLAALKLSEASEAGNGGEVPLRISTSNMQRELGVLASAGNLEHAKIIVEALKRNSLTSEMAIPALKRLTKQDFETAAEWFNWNEERRWSKAEEIAEKTGDLYQVSGIAIAMKNNLLTPAFAIPMLKRMTKQDFETADEWLKWDQARRLLEKTQREKFKGGDSGRAALKKWLKTPNGKTIDEAAAAANERELLVSTAMKRMQSGSTFLNEINQRKQTAQNDAEFMQASRATSYTMVNQAKIAGLAMIGSEGVTLSDRGSNEERIGNTRCAQTLPIACVAPGAVMRYENFWDTDIAPPTVKLTAPVLGSSLKAYDEGDAVCANEFGADWKMLVDFYASFYLGSGQSVAMVTTSIEPATRFWVKTSKYSQRAAFCNAPTPLR